MEQAAGLTECETNDNVQGPFNTKINNWAEGTLMAIDAEGAKLSIRGAKRPYASEYAKMLKSIHDQTAKLTQSERKNMTTEIRESWNVALAEARNHPVDHESDFTFHLPGKDHRLVVVDETPFYNVPTPSTGSTENLTDAECAAVNALKDLKIGECVVVGYESGLLHNSAYAVIKTRNCSTK